MAARPAGPSPVPRYRGLNHVPQLHRWSSSPCEAPGVGRAAPTLQGWCPYKKRNRHQAHSPSPVCTLRRWGPPPRGEVFPEQSSWDLSHKAVGFWPKQRP